MNIRKMTTGDVLAIVVIGNQAPELAVSDVSKFWSEARLRPWVEAGQDVMLVAEEGGEVIGFLITQLHLSSRVGYISDLVVKTSARRRGVGLALMNEAVQQMIDRGLTYLYALTQEHNDAIQGLNKKAGFDAGETMIWFEKKIPH